MKNKCKHLIIEPQPIGSPSYKCDVNEVEKCFPAIKEEYEKLFRKTATPNRECLFINNSEDLSDCPCFETE